MSTPHIADYIKSRHGSVELHKIEMRTLYLIPARGGSKGIPGKNTKVLAGKPLICWTIDAARAVAPSDDIVVSTDSSEICAIAEEAGAAVPFIRPAELASDSASMRDVIIHAVLRMRDIGVQYTRVVLLQPTSPFRKPKQISDATAMYTEDLDMVVSVRKCSENPYYNLYEVGQSGFLTLSKHSNSTRRQDCPTVYQFNGAIYVMNVQRLFATEINKFSRVVPFEMDEYESVDIDTELDWIVAVAIADRMRMP